MRRRGFLGRGVTGSNFSGKMSIDSEDEADHRHRAPEHMERDGGWGVGDDAKMGFG